MDNFKIEDAKQEDVEVMRTIVKNSWVELYPNETYGITREDLLAIDWFNAERLEKRRKEIDSGGNNTHTFVLKDDTNKIVGFCILLKFENYGEVDAMYVLPELQGKGLGKKLMDWAFEWLGGEHDIILKVVAYNSHAIGFYKKMGFKETGNKVIYVGTKLPSGKEIPRIEMMKKVDAQISMREY